MKQWYALRSKPRREESAAALLEKAAIEVYVPRIAVRQQREKVRVLVPLFPGYFFGRLDPLLGEMQLARFTSGVMHIVGYDGQPWPVPDELILSIQQRLARDQGREVVDFRPGDRVLITSGPFQDVEAIFSCQLSAAGRVRVLIQILQRLCPADVHLGQLRPFSQAARAAPG